MTDNGPRGRVALVPAASQGLGYAIASELARAGCRVAICSRDQTRIDLAAAAIAKDTGAEVRPAAVDLLDSSALTRWVEDVRTAIGSPEILIANCGGPPPLAVRDTSDRDFAASFDLVFFSAMRLIRAVLPGMLEAGWAVSSA